MYLFTVYSPGVGTVHHTLGAPLYIFIQLKNINNNNKI